MVSSISRVSCTPLENMSLAMKEEVELYDTIGRLLLIVGSETRSVERQSLISAMRFMSPSTAMYKGR